MLSKLAHHWRQPLNLVGLSIQELRFSYRHGELDQQQLDENVERSMQVLNQLSRSIDTLMEISSPSHQKRRFRVDLTIARTAGLVKDSMQAEGILLRLHCSEEVAADGYRSEYAQVVLSILSNARDALLDHAVVNARITIACWSELGRSVVTISDNAGGIVQDAMDKMFDAFFTTKGPGKGTGINLFLAKMIIEKKMGGSLTVRNAGDGAEFRIEV
jgi:signal transduction histidine kinase